MNNKVKEVLRVVCGLGLMVGFFLLIGFVGNIETHYTRDAKVVSIDGNVVTFECECGYLWDWEKENYESYRKGDKVTLKMFTSGTDSVITDDTIEEVKRQ